MRARGGAATTVRGCVREPMQAKAGAAKDPTAATTRNLGQPWVTATRSPDMGQAQA